MKLNCLLIVTFVIISSYVHAQRYNLDQCIELALKNNNSLKLTTLRTNLAVIQYEQIKKTRLPTANFSTSNGYRFGKSENPSTGILENKNFFSIGANFQSNILIFNWYAKQNSILASKWEAEAEKLNIENEKDILTLEVISAYFQILLANEQFKITQSQLQESHKQLDLIRKQVKVGNILELQALQLETQLALDSAMLTAAKGNIEQSKYFLNQLMNISPKEKFEIELIEPNQLHTAPLSELQPHMLYSWASVNLPKQQMNLLKQKSLNSQLKVAKSHRYPVISAYAGIGTNYGHSKTVIYDQVFSGYLPTGWVINNGSGGFTDVQRPVYINGNKKGYLTSSSIGNQFNENLGQTIGINISIPIMNGGTAKTNFLKSKINLRSQELQTEIEKKNLEHSIYKAYSIAITAMENLSASKKAVRAAEKSYEYTLKKFHAGVITTFELLSTQNILLKTRLEYAQNQFDYIFKIKLLESYKGDGWHQ